VERRGNKESIGLERERANKHFLREKTFWLITGCPEADTRRMMMHHSETILLISLRFLRFAIVREPSRNPPQKAVAWCRPWAGCWQAVPMNEEGSSF
jgi:hypothetical protein